MLLFLERRKKRRLSTSATLVGTKSGVFWTSRHARFATRRNAAVFVVGVSLDLVQRDPEAAMQATKRRVVVYFGTRVNEKKRPKALFDGVCSGVLKSTK